MHLVLSGEGTSDIGLYSYEDGSFVPGAMYYIIDKIIEDKLTYSFFDTTKELITFIPEVELQKVCKKIPSLSGKKKAQETGLFYKNARGLAIIAKKACIKKQDDDVIAILFRDSDGTRSSDSSMWTKKVQSMKYGFESENYYRGVPMIPKPKSEAWLICALKENAYQNCNKLEERSGNDDSPNALKKELQKILEDKSKEYNDINIMIKNNDIDINKLNMDSFLSFKENLERLITQ